MSASFRVALFTMAALVFWHTAGISSSSGGSRSLRTSLACVRVRVCFWWVGCVWCAGVWFGEHAVGRVSEPRDAF